MTQESYADYRKRQIKMVEDVVFQNIYAVEKLVREDERIQAFEDCTNYWKKEIIQILNNRENDSTALRDILKIFGE